MRSPNTLFTCSRMGCIALQGWHHVAKKSTRTSWPLFIALLNVLFCFQQQRYKLYSEMDLYCLVFVGAADWISHANVFLSKNVFMSTMQISYKRVKTCYKMKINYRESKSCFYGFSGIKAPLANHQSPHSALIAPLLQSERIASYRRISFIDFWE